MAYTNISAAALPALMADDDQRGRMVALRVLVKDWAQNPHERPEMIAEAPRRHRWRHRFTARRFDLARIAAVVHALCDRDRIEVPAWVLKHRSPKPIPITDAISISSPYGELLRAEAPTSCAHHNVFFSRSTIEDHRVHGFSA